MLGKIKQIILVVIFVELSVLMGFLLGTNGIDNTAYSKEVISSVIRIENVTAKVEFPTNLKIPKLGINAPVLQVGLDENGKMGVPESVEVVGWYNLGAKPGEKGNAVFAGHLDTITGAPAVFYNLSSLEKGDEIISTDISGKQYRFKVTRKEVYPFDRFPLQDIFGDSKDSSLNLITCAGVFDLTSLNYTQRVVVFSKLE